jgi:hypothetical protein
MRGRPVFDAALSRSKLCRSQLAGDAFDLQGSPGRRTAASWLLQRLGAALISIYKTTGYFKFDKNPVTPL